AAEEKIEKIPVQEEVVEQAKEERREDKPEESRDKVPGMWDKLQQQFIENWTGILGSVVLVMGVGFLGVYTALKFSPPYRFLMIVLFSGLLFGLFYYLKSKSKWIQLALWLRSSAGAIFLFACLGSSTIEGLKWIDHPLKGLGLLLISLGIASNLYLAFAGGNQVFASLHVLLSLTALAIAPPEPITLIVAAVVTLFGIAQTYREKWEYHLLLTISLYFVFHLYWFFQARLPGTAAPGHLTGIICTASVSVLALLVHYRSLYRTTVFERLPFFVHFINWFFFGIGLYIHTLGSPWKTVVIAAGSIAAFFLARKARRIGIPWLYITDTLVAQLVMLIALFSLYHWRVDSFFIVGMMFLETLLFLVITIREEEKFLTAAGTVIKYLLGITLFGWAFTTIDRSVVSSMYRPLIIFSGCTAFALLFRFYLLKKFAKTYDSLSKTPGFKWLPFAVYFTHGFYVGLALFVFSLDWWWKPIALAVLSAGGFLAARYAKSTGMKDVYVKVYRTGALTAQAVALFALFALHMWEVDGYYITGLIFLEILLFLLSMIWGNEKFLWKTGTCLLYLFGVVLIFVGVGNLDYKNTAVLYKHAGTLLICAAAAVFFHLYTLKRFGETFSSFKITSAAQGDSGPTDRYISGIGILIGWLLFSVYMNTHQLLWWSYILAAAGMVLLYIRHRFQSNGLGAGLFIFVLFFHLLGWTNMNPADNSPLSERILYSLPFLILTFTSVCLPYLTWARKACKAFGIYLFYIHFIIASNFSFREESPFITGALWLFASIVTLELACRLRKKYGDEMVARGESDRFLLHMGYLLTGAFLIRHLGVHLDSHHYIGGVPLRLIAALAAISVFFYWALRRLPERKDSSRSWNYLHPLFLELIIFFSILTVTVEVNPRWLSVAWIGGALLCLLVGRPLTGETSRIRFYSLLLYWASTVYTALAPTAGGAGGKIIGSAAIVLQFIYIISIRKLPFLEGMKFPKLLSFLVPLSDLINRRKNLWIHYPLFISVALFLYLSFSRSILTFLWVVECFLIFVAAVILKESHFRYLAMTGLAAALFRLVFYDMAKSETLTRALVFIGVGVIMLVMNSIYNKYKDRF
ncbi:MAG: DUF2339 domain-containing protein, partial [bacterium]|nr:DUF2339 domain-containing protein [bacterium]